MAEKVLKTPRLKGPAGCEPADTLIVPAALQQQEPGVYCAKGEPFFSLENKQQK